jgi:uncharacterized membrane protein YgcG
MGSAGACPCTSRDIMSALAQAVSGSRSTAMKSPTSAIGLFTTQKTGSGSLTGRINTSLAALEVSMDLLLLLPIAIFAFINIIASMVVLRVYGLSISQQTLQLAFIWLVPVFGAVVCLASAFHATHGFSASLRSDGDASSGQDGGGYGGSGSSSCGDSSAGGGDGGGGGC